MLFIPPVLRKCTDIERRNIKMELTKEEMVLYEIVEKIEKLYIQMYGYDYDKRLFHPIGNILARYLKQNICDCANYDLSRFNLALSNALKTHLAVKDNGISISKKLAIIALKTKNKINEDYEIGIFFDRNNICVKSWGVIKKDLYGISPKFYRSIEDNISVIDITNNLSESILIPKEKQKDSHLRKLFYSDAMGLIYHILDNHYISEKKIEEKLNNQLFIKSDKGIITYDSNSLKLFYNDGDTQNIEEYYIEEKNKKEYVRHNVKRYLDLDSHYRLLKDNVTESINNNENDIKMYEKELSKANDKEWIDIYKHHLEYCKVLQPMLLNTLKDCDEYLNGNQKEKIKVK